MALETLERYIAKSRDTKYPETKRASMQAELIIDEAGATPRILLTQAKELVGRPIKLSATVGGMLLTCTRGEDIALPAVSTQQLRALAGHAKVILTETWGGRSSSHLVEFSYAGPDPNDLVNASPGPSAPLEPGAAAKPEGIPADAHAHSFWVLAFVAPLAFSLFTVLFLLTDDLMMPGFIVLARELGPGLGIAVFESFPWLTGLRLAEGAKGALLLLSGYFACGCAAFLGNLLTRALDARRAYAASAAFVTGLTTVIGGALAIALATSFQIHPIGQASLEPATAVIGALGALVAFFGAREGLHA
jgi:hypothetical protein